MGRPPGSSTLPFVLATGLAIWCNRLVATERSATVREDIAASLRSEFRFQPHARSSERAATEDGDVVTLPAVTVAVRKDRSIEIERIYRAERQKAEILKPSVEAGASVQRNLGSLPTTIGPRPYRDLLQEDARFKSPKLVTPTWTLLDMKL